MKGLITLDREFEDEIISDKNLGRQEYKAAWEVYNSQPLFGGSIKLTISFIDKALETTKNPKLVTWLNEYKTRIEAK